MSIWERVRSWARALWAALKAAEAGSYGRMDDRIVALDRRMSRLERERSGASE
jgi:hypothetical protein